MHEQNGKFHEVEIIKNIPKLKKTVTELKDLTENFNSRLDQAGKRISKLSSGSLC